MRTELPALFPDQQMVTEHLVSTEASLRQAAQVIEAGADPRKGGPAAVDDGDRPGGRAAAGAAGRSDAVLPAGPGAGVAVDARPDRRRRTRTRPIWPRRSSWPPAGSSATSTARWCAPSRPTSPSGRPGCGARPRPGDGRRRHSRRAGTRRAPGVGPAALRREPPPYRGCWPGSTTFPQGGDAQALLGWRHRRRRGRRRRGQPSGAPGGVVGGGGLGQPPEPFTEAPVEAPAAGVRLALGIPVRG